MISEFYQSSTTEDINFAVFLPPHFSQPEALSFKLFLYLLGGMNFKTVTSATEKQWDA